MSFPIPALTEEYCQMVRQMGAPPTGYPAMRDSFQVWLLTAPGRTWFTHWSQMGVHRGWTR